MESIMLSNKKTYIYFGKCFTIIFIVQKNLTVGKNFKFQLPWLF